MDEKKIRVAITHGDTNGIGYEQIFKTFASPEMLELCTPIIYGSPKIASYHRKALNIPGNFSIISSCNDIREGRVNMLTCFDEDVKVDFGTFNPDAQKAGAKVDSVKQITFGAPVFVQATGSSEPALAGAVAGVKDGTFSPSVVKGNGGAYLVQVLRKAERPGAAKFDAKAQEQRLQQQAMQAASRFISELYQKANIVDNRYLFF